MLYLFASLCFYCFYYYYFNLISPANAQPTEPTNYGGKIVNGVEAEEGEFPFVVSLRRNKSHSCGGSVINEKFILTAAHCVCNNNTPRNVSLYDVQYGTNKISKKSEKIAEVEQIYCHDFNVTTFKMDAAVLKLRAPLSNKYPWKPVRLSKSFDTTIEHEGVVIGWGRISEKGPIPEKLQKLNVRVYTSEVCEAAEADAEEHVCFGAENAGVCYGDSGSALVVGGTQVGIASHIKAVCGIANETYPNVYARVDRNYEWIQKIIAD